MDNQHKKITGYRDLTQDEIDKMNEIKAKGEEVRTLIDGMQTAVALPGGLAPDPRALAIARTKLQEGFMWLTRSIAKPESF